MTVAKLIERLKTQPQDAVVTFDDEHWTIEVTNIVDDAYSKVPAIRLVGRAFEAIPPVNDTASS